MYFIYKLLSKNIRSIRLRYYKLFPLKKNIIQYYTFYYKNKEKIISLNNINRNIYKITDILKWCLTFNPKPLKICIHYKPIHYSNNILKIFMDIPQSDIQTEYNPGFNTPISEIPYDDNSLHTDNTDNINSYKIIANPRSVKFMI